MSNWQFPIIRNHDRIPERFNVMVIDMEQEAFQELRKSGCSCGSYVYSSKDWEIARQGNNGEIPHIDIFCIVSGSLILTTQNEIIRAEAGKMLIVISWMDRYLHQDEDCQYVYIRYNNPQDFPMIQTNQLRKSENTDVLAFCGQLLVKDNPQRREEKKSRYHLACLMGIMVRRELNQNVNSDINEQVARFFSILQDPKRRDFRETTIAREAGMSVSKLRKFCLANFEHPPREIITRTRFSRARGMLDYTRLSIEEIAEQLGYADRYSFSKAFTKKK